MKKVMILVLFLLMLCASAAAEDAAPANAFQHVPTAYMGNSPADSRVERVTYTAKTAQGLEYVKGALVYLPAGYDDNPDARYDILYLMHGGGENETTFLGGEGLEKPLKHMLDNMISAGKIPPVIVCCPNYRVLYCDETKSTQNFPHELRNHLMPLVETKYSTWAETADDAGFAASRDHRAFAGLSRGAVTTAHSALCGSLDWFSSFGLFSSFRTTEEYLRYLPVALADFAAGNNEWKQICRRPGATGSSIQFLDLVCDIFGVERTPLSDLTQAIELMKEKTGQGVVVCYALRKSPFTNSSHYVVMTGVDEEYFYVLDPLCRTDYTGTDKREILDVLGPGVSRVKLTAYGYSDLSPVYYMERITSASDESK